MSATDELRRLLDERGVEYETDDRNGLRETIWCGTAAFQVSPTAKMTMIVTPKQAISATLGSDDKSRWHELFGTPERAARTLFRIDNSCCEHEVYGKNQSCVTCPLNMNGEAYPKMRCYAHINTGDGFSGEHMDTLLEWLRGDAEWANVKSA